ncbi:MAG: PKD domain-containing protein [Bacteroidales bacterium]|nr:PKD domain-containing protein [Bacteroidales bacterium]
MQKGIKRWVLLAAFIAGSCGFSFAQVRFSADRANGCVPFIVSFTDQSSFPATVTAWEWDFGDGSVHSDKQHPVHTYTSAGRYSVRLKVSFSDGSSRDTVYNRYIHTSTGPVISFTASPDSVCPGFPVAFTSRIVSVEGVSLVSWDFKDGFTDTARHPVHPYTISGLYQPVLRVTDTMGCVTVDAGNVSVYVKPKPKAAFYTPDSLLCIMQLSDRKNVGFVNASQGAAAYEWFFDDGTTSSDFQPVHEFGYGDYDITLVAKAANGCNDTLVKRAHVSLNLFQPGYIVSDTVLCNVPASLTLTGTGASYYRWTLSDGAGHIYEKMGTEYKPTIQVPGYYDLRVIFQHRIGCADTVRLQRYIRVIDTAVIRPQVLIYDEDFCDPNGPISFVNKTVYDSVSQQAGLSLWKFNDGQGNVLGDSVSHVFGQYSLYHRIKAFFTTPDGCPLSGVECRVRISPLDQIFDFSYTLGGCLPYVATAVLKPHYSSDPDSLYTWSSPATNLVRCEWHWGDGDTTVNASAMATHVYQNVGEYYPYVVVTTRQGCTDTLRNPNKKLRVGVPPKCYFTYDSLGIKCKSDFFLSVHAWDSMYYDPQRQDWYPLSEAADEWWWFAGSTLNDSIIDSLVAAGGQNGERSFNGAQIGIGKNTALTPRDTGYVSSLWLVPYFNYCPGKPYKLDSVAYMCPPVVVPPNAESGIGTDVPINSVFCSFPTIRFDDQSYASTERIWFFGNDTSELFGHFWIGDTSHRDTATYTFKNGSYMHNGKGKRRVALVAINTDSTGIRGMYNRCRVCYDTQYVSVRILLMEPELFVSDTEVCTGDTLVFRDSTTSGSALTDWWVSYKEKRGNSDTVILVGYRPHETYLDSVSPSGYGTVRYPVGAVFREPGDYLFRMSGRTAYEVVPTVGPGDTVEVDYMPKSNTCQYADSQIVHVYPKSSPLIQTPGTACAGDTVQFFGDGETMYPYDNYKIIRYLWNAGGRSDTNRNPYYTFRNGGYYDVMLRVTNEKDCDSALVVKKQIFIKSFNVSWSPNGNRYEACNKEQLQLQAKVSSAGSNASLTYRWLINNGKYLYKTPKEVNGRTRISAAFDVDSACYVRVDLFVYDSVSGCTSSFTDSIFIHKPKTDFTSTNPVAPCPDHRVDFADSTAEPGYAGGRIVKYEWLFADRDDTVYVLGKTPTFVYSHPGRYDVTLIVTDAFGCTDTIVKPEYVRVEGADGFFTIAPAEGCLPLQVDFAVTLLHPADSVRLVYGDGSGEYVQVSAPGQVFSYTYRTPGKFIPSMEMVRWTKDASGTMVRCVRKYLGEDTIYAVRLTPLISGDTLVCLGQPCTFRNHTTEAEGNLQPADMGPLDSVVWDYGNGRTDRGVFHGNTQYDSAGFYTVVMRTGIRHCAAQDTLRLRVPAPPVVRITHQDTTACDEVVTVYATDSLRSDVEALEWLFHDGTRSSENPAAHPYDRSGAYPGFLLLTYSPAHCVQRYPDTVLIRIFRSPDAEYRIKDREGQDITDQMQQGIQTGEKAWFTDQSVTGDAPIDYRLWRFGDGDSLSGAQLAQTEHAYLSVSGLQHTFMFIRDTNGCADSVSHDLMVTEFISFPNVFSPNGDGINDHFTPLRVGGYFDAFEMTIYNRWGSVVWQRFCNGGEKGRCPDYTQEDFWWRGQTATGGAASEGVYFWVVSAKPVSGTGDIHLHGSVTLVR